jgi:hydrogenase nickel incorporation protein HypA/HybF
MSLMADLMRKIERLAREQDAGRVVGLKVVLGALSHFSPAHFREHFEHASRGTVAQGARLVIEAGTDVTDSRAQDVWLDSVEVEER